MGILADIISSGIPNLAVSTYILGLTEEQQNEYEQRVDEQIANGISMLEARSRAMLDMIENDPDSNQARAILDDLRNRIGPRAWNEIETVTGLSEKRRKDFLSDFDRRSDSYLSEIDRRQQELEGEYGTDVEGIKAGYGGLEKDILGELEGYGTQALRDTERISREEEAGQMENLRSRGFSLLGGSLARGFTESRADSLARIRESVASRRADVLGNVRGSSLGFQERAATFGAGLGESGINRYSAARGDVDASRAAYDAAMSGETLSRRESALNRAYGLDVGLDQGYADYLAGIGQTRLETSLETTKDLADFMNYGVNYVPPQTAGPYSLLYGAGGSAAGSA